MPEPWDFNIDGIQGLVDLSWNQRVPQVQPDEIDRDPRYNQYLYQEADEYEEDEEMEVDERAPGNAGGTRMAASTGIRCSYHHPEATYSYSTMPDQTLGSPHSIHTDTDAARRWEV